MRLYIIRHSVPEENEEGEPNDDDPGLSDEGKDIVEALGDWMLDKDEVPNVIFASPMSRTQETADILKDKFGLPSVKTDVSIGPHMSVRGLIKKVANDDAMTRVAIVSHHESISNGMRELNGEPWPHLDQMAQGELRIIKVKRKDGSWHEHRRMLPSKLGQNDHY